MHLETQAVHAALRPDRVTGAIAPSMGLEHPDDLIQDLEQALSRK